MSNRKKTFIEVKAFGLMMKDNGSRQNEQTPATLMVVLNYLVPILVFLVGISFFHWVMIKGGGEYVHGDFGDARLNNIFLEHGYRYLFSDWPKEYFTPEWTFYPFPLSLFLSDTFTGNIPFYVPFRLLGFSPLSSFQGWMWVSSFLNFWGFFVFLRMLGLRPISSSFGGFIFSFAQPRSVLLNQAQLLPQFFSVFALICLIRYFQSPRESCKNVPWLVLAAIFTVWQIWAGFYLGWFFLLFLFVIFVQGIMRKESRAILFTCLKKDKVAIFFSLLVFSLLMSPLVVKYHATQAIVGKRTWAEVLNGIIEWRFFFNSHLRSYLYSHTRWLRADDRLMFIGFVAMLCVLAFGFFRFFRSRVLLPFFRHPLVVFLTFDTFLVILLLAYHWGEGISLWRIVFEIVPGGRAIRELIRITMVLLIPVGIMVAAIGSLLEKKAGKFGIIIVLLLGSFLMAENFHSTDHHYLKRQHWHAINSVVSLVKNHPNYPACQAFYYIKKDAHWAVHLNAMWASLELSLPTLNGYSGAYPPHWNLGKTTEFDEKNIDAWLIDQNSPLRLKDICVINKLHP